MNILVMVTAQGFYPVQAVSFVPLEQQAQDHGMLNDHVLQVEDTEGNILWKRTIQ